MQWVNTAWINAMRDEVLRVARDFPEVARVVVIGVWIATFAEKDGGNAYPSRETLATLAGCSQETVTRAVRVLMGVGVLERKRRPNTSAMYQLLMPLGRGLPWAAHIHHMTETRQRKAYAKKKAEGFIQDRKASTDAVHSPSDSDDGRLPERVRVGGSEPTTETPDSVHGRPRIATTDAFRTATTDAPTKPTPTSGRDHHPDHTHAEPSPQPQKRVGARGEDESSTQHAAAHQAEATPPPAGLSRCRRCQIPLIRTGRDMCAGCERALATTHGRHSA